MIKIKVLCLQLILLLQVWGKEFYDKASFRPDSVGIGISSSEKDADPDNIGTV